MRASLLTDVVCFQNVLPKSYNFNAQSHTTSLKTAKTLNGGLKIHGCSAVLSKSSQPFKSVAFQSVGDAYHRAG
jgi:hypothetical protein